MQEVTDKCYLSYVFAGISISRYLGTSSALQCKVAG